MTWSLAEEKAACVAKIDAQLRIGGRPDWKTILAEHPTVNPKTFETWVKDVRCGRVGPNKALYAAKVARVRIKERLERPPPDDSPRPNPITQEIISQLPVAPPAEYIASEPGRARMNIDMLLAVTSLYNDAMKIRNAAVIDDGEGGEKVRNFHQFGESIKHRVRVIETALNCMREIYDLQNMERFYDEIVAIIVDELRDYPEVQRRVMERLSRLNSTQLGSPV